MKVFDKTDPQTPKQEQGEKLPESLQGKTQEEIYQELKAEHNRLMDAEKAKKYDAITENPPTPPTPPPKPATPPGQAPSTPQKTYQQEPPVSYRQPAEAIDLQQDPEGFMDQQFNKRFGPLVNAQVSSNRATNAQLYKMQNPEIVEKYGEEIETFVNALSPELQMNPIAYQKAGEYIRGLHLDEIVAEQIGKKTPAILAKTLAEAGVSEEDIAAIVAKTKQVADAPPAGEEPPPTSSLFGRATGLPPRTATTKTTPPRQEAGGPARVKMTSKEKEMAAEFDMTDEEWAEGRADNTDTMTALREELRGE